MAPTPRPAPAPAPAPESAPAAAEAAVPSPSGTSLDEPLHPLDAHAIRTPVPKTAGVWAVVLTEDDAKARLVADRLRSLLGGRGRPLTIQIASDGTRSRADRLAGALEGANLPLVLVTTASEPWTEAHLSPLLKAIDHADHVLGRRRRTGWQRFRRWLASRPWYVLFAIPLRDVHSPCRLHRREALERLPLQSRSRFLDVEMLAKASFFAQLVDDPEVPDLPDAPGPPGFRLDFAEVFRRPALRRDPASAPPEDPQGDDERDDRPAGEDQQVRPDVHQARPFEDHPS